MEVVRFYSELESEWNRFVKNSKNGLFFFNTSYLFYHKDRFVDHSLCFYNEKKELIAVFPANELGETIYSHQGLTFGSLVISRNTKAKEVLDIFDALILYYRNLGFKKLIYKAIPCIFSEYPAQEDLYALFRNNAKLYRRDLSSVIPIDNKIEFSQSKKNLVNRNNKNGLEVVEDESIEEFWDLLTQVLAKFETAPVHSKEEIILLKKHFPDEIKLYTVREDTELLAGTVIFDFKTVIHTQYMANSAKGRKLGALDFINYQLINKFYNDRRYYSFGISNEDGGRVLNEGLIQQKELMGGRGVALDFYEIDLI